MAEVVFTLQVNPSSPTVIKFVSTVFSRERDPKEVISDNGAQFSSLEFDTFLAEWNIVLRRSSVYCHQANGEIEHFNRSLKGSLQTAKLEGKHGQTSLLISCKLTPVTWHATTQKSPAELIHRREMHPKLDIAGLLQSISDASLWQKHRNYSPRRNHLISCHGNSNTVEPHLRETVVQIQEKYKAYTGKSHSAKELKFKCGSLVRKPGILRKGEQIYINSQKCWEKTHKATLMAMYGMLFILH